MSVESGSKYAYTQSGAHRDIRSLHAYFALRSSQTRSTALPPRKRPRERCLIGQWRGGRCASGGERTHHLAAAQIVRLLMLLPTFQQSHQICCHRRCLARTSSANVCLRTCRSSRSRSSSSSSIHHCSTCCQQHAIYGCRALHGWISVIHGLSKAPADTTLNKTNNREPATYAHTSSVPRVCPRKTGWVRSLVCRTHTHTHARTHARTHAHMHTRARALRTLSIAVSLPPMCCATLSMEGWGRGVINQHVSAGTVDAERRRTAQLHC